MMQEVRRRFTLLEMAAVLLIVALVSAMAVVMIAPRAVSPQAAASHAERLSTLLAAARGEAAASGAAQQVALVGAPRRWLWRENGRELPVPDGVGVSGRRIHADEFGVDPAGEEIVFHFSPGGIPEAAEARISDRGGEITVASSPLSCRILVVSAPAAAPEPLWDSERESR